MLSSNRLIKDELEKKPESKQVPETKGKDALENHIASFAGPDGLVDEKSIEDVCVNKMHLSQKQAHDVAVKTMRAALYCGVPGVYFCYGATGNFKPKDAVPVFTHPHDSGLFDRHTGAFHDELYKILQEKYSITDNDGEKIISRAKMEEFILKETQQAARWIDAGWLFNQVGKTGNKGEFDVFFEKTVSRFKKNAKNEDEGYVTLTDLKQWYLDSRSVLEKMEKYELPKLAAGALQL